jgi:hypothetical protein
MLLIPRVRDFEADDEYILEQDSVNIAEILRGEGVTDDYSFLIVKIKDAEYVEIWGGYGIPYLHTAVFQVK